jgi:hypothetical protein
MLKYLALASTSPSDRGAVGHATRPVLDKFVRLGHLAHGESIDAWGVDVHYFLSCVWSSEAFPSDRRREKVKFMM